LYEPCVSDFDTRYDNSIEQRWTRFCAHLSPVTDEHTKSGSGIDWPSNRGWFDERVKAARRHDLDNRIWWTGAHFPGGPGYQWVPGEGECEDSCFENDYELWECRQDERDQSLTFTPPFEQAGAGSSSILDSLDEIIQVQ
jgi:hypothetical protein